MGNQIKNDVQQSINKTEKSAVNVQHMFVRTQKIGDTRQKALQREHQSRSESYEDNPFQRNHADALLFQLEGLNPSGTNGTL